MSTNKGILCRDVIGANLHIKGRKVIDENRNIVARNVVANKAELRNNLEVKGDVTVDGTLCSVINDKTGWHLYDKIQNATVSVYINGGSCSGWFVTSDGWVATAAHCVLNGALDTGTPGDEIEENNDVFVEITNYNGTGTTKGVNPTKIYVDGAGDFCMMYVPGITNQAYLEWGDITQECVGNRCFVVGNPLGSDPKSISDGLIRDKNYKDALAHATEGMLFSCPAYPGNSGSPVINEKCQVIGLVSYNYTFFNISGTSRAISMSGGPTSRAMIPVANWIMQNCDHYRGKGWLGFYPWFTANSYYLYDVFGFSLSECVTGMFVIVSNVSPARTPVSGPPLPNDYVLIREINGGDGWKKVGMGQDEEHISNTTWNLTSGDNVTLRWSNANVGGPSSGTVYETVVTLGVYPPYWDGFGLGDLKLNHQEEKIPPFVRNIGEDPTYKKVLSDLINTTYSYRDPTTWPGEEELLRIAPANYADGISTIRVAPNPRTISNEVFAQSVSVPNSENLTDMFWLFGQFLDHDIDLSGTLSTESLNIPVPSGDSYFDPESTGNVEISFERSAFSSTSGNTTPREQTTLITSFMDCTNIYGTTEARANWLRSYSGGKMKRSQGELPPLNDGTMDNAGPTGGNPYVVGDVRGNENVALLSMHTTFMRNHNWWADQIAKQNPSLTDEEIYQKARVMNESEYQSIAWYEFLPILLGAENLPPYTGYNASVDHRVSNEFSTAAYRLGHSLVSDVIWRLDDKGQQLPLGNLTLKDAFWAPHRFANEGGMEPIFRGMSTHICENLDSKLVDSLRNFLFGMPGSGGLDLAALNIQRGRDHGLATYNETRVALGLPARTAFSEISSDSGVATDLSVAYGGDINQVDLWVGGIAEDHLEDSQLGETFHAIVLDQFVRLRDSDPMWYEARLTADQIEYVNKIKLSDILKRNLNNINVQDNVFVAPN